MSDLIVETQHKICILSLNRTDKCNAFDDKLLTSLHQQIEKALQDATIRVLVLKARGKHFSAGADLDWMQRMVQYTEADNLKDAQILAKLMHSLYQSKKPTLAMVQGAAYGGGAGLVAACDMAIASVNATFCFSEVRLGLVPAVISPYVIRAIGARAATALFMSAEEFDAARAKELGLINRIASIESLEAETMKLAKALAELPQEAVQECKKLVREVEQRSIDHQLLDYTAQIIAKKRVSKEGQKGLQAFLNKEKPNWG